MARYRLIHRQGFPGAHTFQVNLFDAVDAALNETRKRYAAANKGDFIIETRFGCVVMNDREIAEALSE